MAPDEHQKKQLRKVDKTLVQVGDGLFLTPMQMQYCEDVVYGGAYRTIKQWATYCGVDPATITSWNAVPAVNGYMEELRKNRRQMLFDVLAGGAGAGLTELVRIAKTDPYTPGTLNVRASVLAEKRAAAEALLNFVKNGGANVVELPSGGGSSPSRSGLGSKGETGDLHDMTPEEVEQELRELRAMTGKPDEPK